ncbi:MAG: lipase family protein [Chitinophagales bacterium]|nr:lipase family protein [Chitinophagales bacterium]
MKIEIGFYNIILLLSTLLSSKESIGQLLKPGFEKAEYIEMLKIAQRQHTDLDKWNTITTVPEPEKFKFAYRSPVMGLDNIWDLWLNNEDIAVISIRGSVESDVSFLVNFYAAMVPAKGELQLEKSFTFKYNLSNDPKAAVHVGFLVAMAYLSRDILPKIDSCYTHLGIKDFIIAGQSQGGGISYLLTSYLENLKSANRLPSDIRFKTYCGASPKPGNLFYAYDFENVTRDGWAYNVVSTADWVPEVPFSIQTVNDFSNVNPFRGAKDAIKKQNVSKAIVLNHVYNRLSNPALKAQRRYEQYLGKMVSKSVKKQLPEFKHPEYYKSNHYVRTGTTIVLYADEDYYKIFPEDLTKVWRHHFIEPYLYLTERLK